MHVRNARRPVLTAYAECSAQIEMTEIEPLGMTAGADGVGSATQCMRATRPRRDAEDADDDGALAWGLPIAGA
eukprot:COSAG02_NODE_2969_length_7640_cov_2.657870_6_plen_73_part_00